MLLLPASAERCRRPASAESASKLTCSSPHSALRSHTYSVPSRHGLARAHSVSHTQRLPHTASPVGLGGGEGDGGGASCGAPVRHAHLPNQTARPSRPAYGLSELAPARPVEDWMGGILVMQTNCCGGDTCILPLQHRPSGSRERDPAPVPAPVPGHLAQPGRLPGSRRRRASVRVLRWAETTENSRECVVVSGRGGRRDGGVWGRGWNPRRCDARVTRAAHDDSQLSIRTHTRACGWATSKGAGESRGRAASPRRPWLAR